MCLCINKLTSFLHLVWTIGLSEQRISVIQFEFCDSQPRNFCLVLLVVKFNTTEENDTYYCLFGGLSWVTVRLGFKTQQIEDQL